MKFHWLWNSLLLLAAITAPMSARAATAPAAAVDVREARLGWWRQARFGLFLHWGPVSLKGTEIGWSRGKEVPTAEYDQLYQRFNPEKFSAAEWVHLAKAAGMKYIVLTAKHHDGFCLWDSQLTDYTITHTPFRRDIVKELATECRKQGLRFCTYYSILDWHHPDYPIGEAPGGGKKLNPDMQCYLLYMQGQLRELITRYGPLGILWFDGEWEAPWTFDRAVQLERELRDLQPSLIINNRIGKARAGMSGVDKGQESLGDYATPEQELGKFNRDLPWETNMTLGRQWAWKPNDEIKSLADCIRSLVTCAGGDGNFLLNVGPMPSGEIESRQVERLKEIGQWLEKYGESIYGTRGGPFQPSSAGVSTSKGKTIYVHILKWREETVQLPAIPAQVQGAVVLTGGSASLQLSPEGIALSLSAGQRDSLDTIIALKLDRRADQIPPLAWTVPELARSPERAMKSLRVLVFSKTLLYRHASITNGIAALKQLGHDQDFSVEATEDSNAFTPDNLRNYQVVIFLSTSGDILDDAQQIAFKNYIENGGGLVAIHAGAAGKVATEGSWPWYVSAFGAEFSNHKAIARASVHIEDRANASTAHLPWEWSRTDEWYNFTASPRGKVHVLATLDESSFPGGTMGPDHPIAWCRKIGRGRLWYTALGHTEASYGEPQFRQHLLGGIQVAAGIADCDFSPNVAPHLHSEPSSQISHGP